MKKSHGLRICMAILLIIIQLTLSGCWDSRELNKLSIISALGWDINKETGMITMTYQSIIPSMIKNSSGADGGGEQKGGSPLNAVQLDQSTGSSPYDALNRYSQHNSRVPFYQHIQVYVIGKNVAEHGIYSILDSIARNPVSRPNILMVVSEKKASDILEVQDGMENIQAVGMAAEIKLSAYYSKFPAVTSLEFANRVLSKTTAPIAPIIGIFEKVGLEGKKTKIIRIIGTAVFKEDKLIGKLNERESSGLLWAINKAKKGYVMTPEASFGIIKAKSKILPELKEDGLEITIEIDEESVLLEYKGHKDMTSEILEKLEKEQAKEIKSLVMAAVEKAFSLDADILGFGEVVHRKYKKAWKDMEPIWDKVYPTIKVVVNVKTHITEIGDANRALIKD